MKSFVPTSILSFYHEILARFSAFLYLYPSEEMIVIGVTGTNGKTTTAYLIAKALEATGEKTGCTTTAILKIADKEWLNSTKMTMPGRFFLSRILRKMVKAGCHYAIIETSSQGLMQSRHIGINYDVAVFTNLTPEHIEAHGGFENYKCAKKILFEHTAKGHVKRINGVEISKRCVLNADSEYSRFFGEPFSSDKIIWYGIKNHKGFFPNNIEYSDSGSEVTIGNIKLSLKLLGEPNVENALATLATTCAVGIDLERAAARLSTISGIPGRFERINIGQPWTVVIDYAPEPESLKRLYDTLMIIPHKRIIHVLGSCGGGRDIARRPMLGRLAGERADVVIVTNEDPYDDDPSQIIDHVAQGALEKGKIEGKTLFKVLDRKEAINTAMRFASANDLVLLTGKGCEPWICVANGDKIPWNEKYVAEEAIRYVKSINTSSS